MTKINFYHVAWSERHEVVIKAKDENEAIDKISRSEFNAKDESAELETGFDASKICDICGYYEDPDGRCGCTNKDSK